MWDRVNQSSPSSTLNSIIASVFAIKSESEYFWLARGVHFIAIVCAAITVGATLYFIAGSIGLYVQNSDTVISWILTALPWVLLAGTGWAIWKRLSYRAVLPALGLCGAFVFYLVWDDLSRPIPPELGVVVSEGDPSFRTYRWLLKDDPQNRLSEESKKPELPRLTGSQDEWASIITQNRRDFEEAWTNDTLGRAWVDAMAAHTPEGIFPPQGVKGPSLSFSILRRHCTIRWGIAHSLLLDGQNDEAARTLLPLLRASYHLQQGGSSLVTQMIANVAIHGTFARLELILTANNLSPAMKSEIAGVLRGAPAIQLSIKNAFLGEHVVVRSSVDAMKSGYTELADTFKLAAAWNDADHNYDVLGIPILVHLFFNPHRFEREYSDFLDEACKLAQQRKLDRLSETTILSWRLKNPVGQLLTAMTLPAFQKVFVRFWETEDQRLAFLRRLEP